MENVENKSNCDAMNQLQKLIGLENVKKHFERYRANYKSCCEGRGDVKFNQHMVFMGNPGTGKTTVAKLFTNILYEDGLLSRGQFVEATPVDLISDYIGQTRAKAEALCERAKGGVLFLDEAYGIIIHNGFGQEAIDVLIQFMVNNDDSLVILADYTNEMKKFLDHTGIGRHFITNEFYFDDYTNE